MLLQALVLQHLAVALVSQALKFLIALQVLVILHLMAVLV